MKKEVLAVVEEEGRTWMTPVYEYLTEESLPEEKRKARAIYRKAERENKSLGKGIKARLDKKSKNWLQEISHVLWAHRTMIYSSNGEMPFVLTYRTEAMVPIEIGMPTLRTAKVDMIKNDEAWKST
nr:reverse transcriptase domain-containing protein [Tanacetum cinerariifolium]